MPASAEGTRRTARVSLLPVQDVDSGVADWEDPLVFERSRLGMHVPLFAYESPTSALEQQPGDPAPASANMLTLTPAKWHFMYCPTVEGAPEPTARARGYDRTASGEGLEWGEIDVPMSIELAGHGSPIYTNFIYPFDPHLSTASDQWDRCPRVPANHNSCGCYETSFVMPAAWAGRRVILHFGGVEAAFHCWIDGELVGYSQDSRLPAEFDVSRFARRGAGAASAPGHAKPTAARAAAAADGNEADAGGSNGGAGRQLTLSVRVYRFCDGSYLEDQDHWWLSGIHRDVYFYAKDKEASIMDYRVHTDIEWPVAQPEGSRVPPVPAGAAVRVDVSILGDRPGAGDGLSIAWALHGPYLLGREPPRDSLVAAGEAPVRAQPALSRAAVEAAGTGLTPLHMDPADWAAHCLSTTQTAFASFAVRVPSPKLWSAEEPWLYRLVLSLAGDDVGRAAGEARWSARGRDCEACFVGLREVRIRDAQLCVNGVPLRVRGVNRHDHCPARGKAVPRELMVKDIALMKKLNFNAVRTAHYPNASLWYDLCDALGLYVVDEANIETHGFFLFRDEGFLAKRPAWRPVYIARGARMVARDRNHPCVIAWSLGNEAGFGSNLEALSDALKRMDGTRPVQYESCGALPYTDVICPMYPSAAKLESMATAQGQCEKYSANGRVYPPEKPQVVGRRPVIMCEYQHAMGNSTGNFKRFWDVVRRVDCVQGGFIWDWCDQGLLLQGAVAAGEGSRAGTGAGGACGSGAGDARDASPAQTAALQRTTTPWGYGGDFGELYHDAQFNINGLVWPDRTPHPGCYEIKYVQQPVGVELDAWTWEAGDEEVCARGQVTVRNDLDFASLDHLCWTARLLVRGACAHKWEPAPCGGFARDGHPLRLQCALPVSALPVALLTEGMAQDCAVLEVSFELARGTPWAPAGHEVAFDQFGLAAPPLPRRCTGAAASGAAASTPRGAAGGPSGGGGVVLQPMPEEGRVRAHTTSAVYEFEMRTGMLVSARAEPGGDELLAEPLGYNFWRAPTDNDHGGVEFMHRWTWVLPTNISLGIRLLPRLPYWLTSTVDWMTNLLGLPPVGPNVSYRTIWRREGWDRLQPRSEGARTDRDADGAVTVTCVTAMVDPDTGFERALTQTSTRVMPSGDVWVTARCEVHTPLPSIPRVGFKVAVPSALNAVSWYGRGPHENYEDRKGGARVGIHKLPAVEMHTPYIVPCDNGLRCDVHWLALCDQAGSGIVLKGVPPMKVSVSPFSIDQLEAKLHDHELVPGDKLHVCLDNQHMGVGGDDSWSRSVYPEFCVPRGTYNWAVGMRPLAPGDSPGDAAANALLEAPPWVKEVAKH